VVVVVVVVVFVTIFSTFLVVVTWRMWCSVEAGI